MKKFSAILIIFLATIFLAVVPLGFAQNSPAIPSIPERNGDYPDPLNPRVRVRVFVHEPKKATVSESTTCSDPDSSAVVDPTGWHLSSPWTYRLNVNSAPPQVGATSFATLAQLSFQDWQDATLGKVTFQRGENTSVDKTALDWQNVVTWGRTSGTALAITYTRYYPSDGLVADVDTIFNNNKKIKWSWTPYQLNLCGSATSYDAQNILVHELGHWMGLDDEYDAQYVDNTMYGWGSKGEIKKDTLTLGDKANLSTIYP